jgi:peptidoglycan/LPS O-acetylase OafA/YrhL
MPLTNASAGRMRALDGLRGVAAMAVLVLHVWMFDHGDAGRPEKNVLDRVLGEFRLGVPLFFVLSGFLLHRAFAGRILDRRPAPSVRRYALHRAARIVPGYWLALAGAWIVLSAAGHPLLVGPSEIPVFLLFLHNHFDATARQMDPPMWTLGVEVSFYLLLPLVAIAARRLGPGRRRQFAVCAALTLGGMGTTWLSMARAWPDTVTTSLLTWLPLFTVGMGTAVLVHGRTLSRRDGWALLAAGAALIVADGAWHSLGIGPYGVRVVGGDVPAAIGFAMIVAALVAAPLRARVLSSRPAVMLGDLSYGVYLWHYLAIIWLRSNDRWSSDLGEVVVLTAALTLAAAAVSWFFLERPVLRAVRRTAARDRERREETGRAQPAPATSG